MRSHSFILPRKPHGQAVYSKVMDDGAFRPDGTQHATQEQLSTFWSATCIYAKAKSKLSGRPVFDIARQAKETQSSKNRIAVRTRKVKKHEYGKSQYSERLNGALHIDNLDNLEIATFGQKIILCTTQNMEGKEMSLLS